VQYYDDFGVLINKISLTTVISERGFKKQYLLYNPARDTFNQKSRLNCDRTWCFGPDAFDMENETEIIKSVMDGRADDFASLVTGHQGKVYSICLSLLRSPVEAEDAAQAVFIKAYRNIKKFRFEAAFSTWLYRIAYNLCADILKEKAEKKEDAMDREPAEPAPGGVGAEERVLIEKALAGLPEDYRAILVMREGSGMSYEEMAAAADISVEAVRSRLRRARAMFSAAARHFLAP